jgi:putative DNA primase/helicase
MFRTVEMARPTLLIDEADTFLAANEELRGILNSGHSKDGNVIRLVGDDHEPRAFSTWCPTAIAAIGRLPNTIDDRSIKIVMRRRRRDESVERIGESGIKELSVLARKARRWVDDHIDELRAADPLVPNELHDRAADNWRPLLAIADVANAELSKVARHVAIVLSKSSVTDQESWRIQLLSDIRSLFSNRGIDRIPSDDAVSYLIGLDERPWSEMNKGRNMTKTTLARFLKPFEIAPTTIRVNERTVKGYHLAMFEDAFSRYLDPVPPAQGVTT